MPFRIAPKKVTPRRKLVVSVNEALVENLKRYCEYLGDATDPAHVVEQLLETLFAGDKDFRKWLAAQQGGQKHAGPSRPAERPDSRSKTDTGPN